MEKEYLKYSWNMNSEPVKRFADGGVVPMSEDYNELMIAINNTESTQMLYMLGKHFNKIKKTFPLVQVEFALELYQEKLNELNS